MKNGLESGFFAFMLGSWFLAAALVVVVGYSHPIQEEGTNPSYEYGYYYGSGSGVPSHDTVTEDDETPVSARPFAFGALVTFLSCLCCCSCRLRATHAWDGRDSRSGGGACAHLSGRAIVRLRCCRRPSVAPPPVGAHIVCANASARRHTRIGGGRTRG